MAGTRRKPAAADAGEAMADVKETLGPEQIDSFLGEQESEEAPPAQAASRPSYAGMEIVKRVVNFGIGGALEIPDEIREAAPRSVITLQAEADLGAVKHKFTDAGVEEQVILTIRAESVHVLEIAAPPPKPQQGTIDEAIDNSLGELAQEPPLGDGDQE